MKLTIPELFFVALIGVSKSGKSTFARNHFKESHDWQKAGPVNGPNNRRWEAILRIGRIFREILFTGDAAADAARWRAEVIFSRWLAFPG